MSIKLTLRYDIPPIDEYSTLFFQAAYLMYEMAWKMSKDTNDLLW